MKLTGWYDGCQKPVRAGLYRRRYADSSLVLWAYWTGTFWGCAADTQQSALEFLGVPSIRQCLPWRGIAGPVL